MRWIVIGLVAVVVAAGGWLGWAEWRLTKIDLVPYRVEQADGAFEVRRYPTLVLASVDATGSRGEALSEGFEPLSDFISGDNKSDDRIDMTAPVLQKPADADANTTGPAAGENQWTISFVMPNWFTAGTLPQPTDEAIKIASVPPLKAAVVTFSGFLTDDKLASETDLLRAWMADNKLTAGGAARYAIYDPPWRLPFLRRNEVIIPLAPPE